MLINVLMYLMQRVYTTISVCCYSNDRHGVAESDSSNETIVKLHN